MNDAAVRRFGETVRSLIDGRQRISGAKIGIDKDAALKSRLTGVPLDETILTIDLYR